MKTQNIYEVVHRIFPDVPQQQIIKDLDIAQKKFSSYTGELTTRGQLSSISTNVAWSLPSDFKRLTDVVFYDSSGNPLYMGDFNYGYQIEFGKFYIYSLTSTPITGLDDGIDTAYIHYVKNPTTLTGVSSTLEIPTEYRDALVSDILEHYYSMYPVPIGTKDGQIISAINIQAASYHRSKYKEIKIQAKRDYNLREKHDEAKIYQYAGKFEQPRRTDDASLGSTTTTQVTAITDLYAKYVAYTFNNLGTVTETVPQVGYSTVSGTVAGNTFILTSTAEFGLDTTVIVNNNDVTYSYDSSSQITFTLPAGWGTIAVEIYERA